MTILCIFGFTQHITCFVIHCVTQWLTMPGTAGLVLLSYLSRDRQHVKSVFVELSTLFRRLNAFSTCAVCDTNFPTQGAILTHSLRRGLVELEDFGIAHLSNQNFWFLSEMVDLKSLSATFSCLGDFQIVQLIVLLFLCALFPPVQQWNVECLGFEIYTTTATGLPVLMLFALTIIGFLESVRGRSFRLCCEFGTIVTRGSLGDWCTLQSHSSPVFMHTTFSYKSLALWSLIEFLWASFKLHQYTVLWWAFQVCLYGAILGLPRSHSTSFRSCRASIGFTAVKNTDCLSLLRLFPPGISPLLIMECISKAFPMW